MKQEVLGEKGFVFLDAADRPFWCRMYQGQAWLFYLNQEDKWVSYRPVTQNDIFGFPRNLNEEQQRYYREIDALADIARLLGTPKIKDDGQPEKPKVSREAIFELGEIVLNKIRTDRHLCGSNTVEDHCGFLDWEMCGCKIWDISDLWIESEFKFKRHPDCIRLAG